MRAGTMSWFALLVAAATVVKDEAASQDQKALQGTWTVVEAEQDGQPLDRIKGNTLVIDGDKFTIKTKTSDLKGAFQLHAGIKPKGMDMTHTEGAVKGRTWHAIYALDGDD